MICQGCAAGADNMQDYRDAAQEDDDRRALAGEPRFAPGPARRWIRKRARFALALHCRKVGLSGCTCQCEIPELSDRA